MRSSQHGEVWLDGQEGSNGADVGRGVGVVGARMTTMIKNCESLGQLYGLVQAHAAEFNHINFRAATRKLSDLILANDDDAWNEEDWLPLFNRAAALAPTWSAEDMSQMAYRVSAFEGRAASGFKGALQRRALQMVLNPKP